MVLMQRAGSASNLIANCAQSPLIMRSQQRAGIKALMQLPAAKGTTQWFSLKPPLSVAWGKSSWIYLILYFLLCKQSYPEEKSNSFPHWGWKVRSQCLYSKEFHFGKIWDRTLFSFGEKDLGPVYPMLFILVSGAPTDFKREFPTHPCRWRWAMHRGRKERG